MFIKHPGNQATCTYRWPPLPHSKDPGNMHTQPHPPVLHSKDTPTSNCTERIPGMRLHTHTQEMGRYRYQIFNTVNTGLCSDGIDMCKHYRCVSLHACATLRMRWVYVSTHYAISDCLH